MNRPVSAVLLVLAALLGAGGAAAGGTAQDAARESARHPEAPDGKRGFGAGLDAKALAALLRSKDPADREFQDHLTELALSTRVRLLGIKNHYAARGWFKLLPGSAGDDLPALHAAYALVRDDPGAALAAGTPRSRALAEMLVDTRFNVRRDLVTRAVAAVTDLERARAVLGATQVGYVDLSQPELEHIAARADFAAAELRALRSDLESLQPQDTDQDADAPALAAELLQVARNRDEHARAAGVRRILIPRHELEARMLGVLSSARMEPKLRPLREWRERTLDAAMLARARTLEMLPDTPEGKQAPPQVARLKKTDRMSAAHGFAIEGLGNDPLDPELAWAAGHSLQLSWPSIVSIGYFDRFLALSGIRTSDANPGNGRKLTPREQEAWQVVAAGIRR